jgi:hypothetical protein
VKRPSFRLAALIVVLAMPLGPGSAGAQRPDTVAVGARRAMVTREELRAALDEIQRGLSSTVYSSALRSAKQAEANVIRDRLDEGDFRPGDEIKVSVLLEPGLSATYTVTSFRTIILPGNTEISVRKVLRSEIQGYLTKELTRVVNDPSVTAEPSVRISIFGGVGHPGFYNAPASMLLSTFIQDPTKGGGPANNVQWKKSQIIRNGTVVVDGPEFSQALFAGLTLDQLNIQAGDVIQVAIKPASGLFWRIVAAATGLGGIVYLATVLFR